MKEPSPPSEKIIPISMSQLHQLSWQNKQTKLLSVWQVPPDSSTGLTIMIAAETAATTHAGQEKVRLGALPWQDLGSPSRPDNVVNPAQRRHIPTLLGGRQLTQTTHSPWRAGIHGRKSGSPLPSAGNMEEWIPRVEVAHSPMFFLTRYAAIF